MRLLASFALSLAFVSVAVAGDEPVFSGPQAGEKITPFTVTGVYDEQAGKELDFVKDAAGKPTMLIFVHKLTRPGAALFRGLNAYAVSQKEKGARAYIVWLDDDKSNAEQYLTRARKSLNFTVPVGISTDGGEGPGAYGLNRNVELTILVAKDNKVTANFALVQPSVNDAEKIAAALAKLIDAKAPTQEELTKLAYPNREMRDQRNPRNAGNQVDPELGNLLRAVIQKDLDAAGVQKAAAAVEKFVADDANHRATVARIAGVIVERKYGTEAAQKQAKRWVEKYGKKEAKPE